MLIGRQQSGHDVFTCKANRHGAIFYVLDFVLRPFAACGFLLSSGLHFEIFRGAFAPVF